MKIKERVIFSFSILILFLHDLRLPIFVATSSVFQLQKDTHCVGISRTTIFISQVFLFFWEMREDGMSRESIRVCHSSVQRRENGAVRVGNRDILIDHLLLIQLTVTNRRFTVISHCYFENDTPIVPGKKGSKDATIRSGRIALSWVKFLLTF